MDNIYIFLGEEQKAGETNLVQCMQELVDSLLAEGVSSQKIEAILEENKVSFS